MFLIYRLDIDNIEHIFKYKGKFWNKNKFEM